MTGLSRAQVTRLITAYRDYRYARLNGRHTTIISVDSLNHYLDLARPRE